MYQTAEMNQPKLNTQNIPLTNREKAVLQEIAEGFMYKEIAFRNNICIDTVKKHCKNIYRKMNFKNRTHAASYYNETVKGDGSLGV